MYYITRLKTENYITSWKKREEKRTKENFGSYVQISCRFFLLTNFNLKLPLSMQYRKVYNSSNTLLLQKNKHFNFDVLIPRIPNVKRSQKNKDYRLPVPTLSCYDIKNFAHWHHYMSKWLQYLDLFYSKNGQAKNILSRLRFSKSRSNISQHLNIASLLHL